MDDTLDVVIVGAGAAGLATAIFARRAAPNRHVLVLDGVRHVGAKILVSGGSRCNVTNRVVTERDFWGGRRSVVRRVLRSFGADDTIAFFRAIGVSLHEEEDGKLFPDTNRARDVLAALLRELVASGAELRCDHRVHAIDREASGFRVATSRGTITAERVVLATGGQSLPKSGSDGAGFAIAQALGHTLVPTTPGLVPLVFGADTQVGSGVRQPMDTQVGPGLAQPTNTLAHTLVQPDASAPARSEPHGTISAPTGPASAVTPPYPSGVSHDAELAVWVEGRIALRLRGALLWTHFGISGPVALNASRHWLRARLEQRDVRLTASFAPGQTFATLDAQCRDTASERPKLSIASWVGSKMPASLAAAVLQRLGVDGSMVLAHVSRDDRRRLVNALLEWPLPVTGSRGYNYAEVTAGGVALDEIDPGTMASRICPGLYLVGEMLDVDGRLGGFNFQWAWSTAFVAGRALGLA